MDNFERQAELDNLMKVAGQNKADNNAERMEKEEGLGSTVAGSQMANKAVGGFVKTFRNWAEAQASSHASPVVRRLLVIEEGEVVGYKLDPAIIGKIVIKGLLSSIARPEDRKISVTGVAFDIGETVERAIKESILDMEFKKEKSVKMGMLKRQGKLGDKVEIARVLEMLGRDVSIDHEDWTKKEHGNIGVALVTILMKSPIKF